MGPGRYVLPETVALVAVAMADLVLTVYLLATGSAREANPMMAFVLNRFGPRVFIATKALLVAVPVAVAETARKRHPQTARTALRVALALYVIAWLAGIALLNPMV